MAEADFPIPIAPWNNDEFLSLVTNRMVGTCNLVQMAAPREVKIDNICPECGHRFRGNGFDGIDAHWRAKHEHLMPYREAWPLIRTGTYNGRGSSARQYGADGSQNR